MTLLIAICSLLTARRDHLQHWTITLGFGASDCNPIPNCNDKINLDILYWPQPQNPCLHVLHGRLEILLDHPKMSWFLVLSAMWMSKNMLIDSNIILFHFTEFHFKSCTIKRWFVLTKTETEKSTNCNRNWKIITVT